MARGLSGLSGAGMFMTMGGVIPMPKSQLFEAVPLLKMVKVDFPDASELLVEFPDKWVAIARLTDENEPLYVAVWTEKEHNPDFHGLKLGLTHYSLVRFFQPFPMPSVYVAWNTQKGVGEVIGHGDLQKCVFTLSVRRRHGTVRMLPSFGNAT